MAAEAHKTLLQALLAVQKEIPRLALKKSGEGQIGSRSYSYLTLDKLHDAVLPVLSRHGLVWITRPSIGENGPSLTYELRCPGEISDAEGYKEALMGVMPLMLDKPNMQALGSAITYARRYSLLSVLGAVADEDDDGAAAVRSGETTQKIDKADRPLTDEELKAMRMAIQESGLSEPLLLSAAGVDKVVRLSHARIIRQKLDEQGLVA